MPVLYQIVTASRPSIYILQNVVRLPLSPTSRYNVLQNVVHQCPCPHRRSTPPHFPKLHITAQNTHRFQSIIRQFLQEIAKSNIVGYSNVATEKVGLNTMAQAFDAIAKEGFNLVDIKPVIDTETEEMYTGGIVIMTLTDGGETDKTYIWTLAEDAGDGEGEGWFDDMGVRVVDKVFLPGEGFLVGTDFETSKLMTAGQVAIEDTVFTMITGLNCCGNTTSASFKLGEIEAGVGIDESGNMLMVNEDGDELYTGGIVIMTLTDGGETDQTYIYTLAEDAGDGEGAGWFDDMGVRCDESVSFDAGIGFLVGSDYVAGCIRIPSAL